MKSKLIAGVLISGLGFAAHAMEPAKVQDGMLVDQAGLTLYIFDKDAPSKSNCNGGCATVWPPLVASAEASASGKFNIVARDDGSRQWTYQDKPLYRYAADQKPGDMTGENSGGVWHTVRPGRSAEAAKPARASVAVPSYGSY